MKQILAVLAIALSLAACAGTPAPTGTGTESPQVSTAPGTFTVMTAPPPGFVPPPAPAITPAPAPAPGASAPASTGLNLPQLTGNPTTDITNILTWLGNQTAQDLTASYNIAVAGSDTTGKMCFGWGVQEQAQLPSIINGAGVFSDVKGPISAFEKARVLLQNATVVGTGSNGLLEAFNINCSPYIQSINYRAGQGALMIAGAVTTGGAAAPGLGAVQQLLNQAPKLFGL